MNIRMQTTFFYRSRFNSFFRFSRCIPIILLFITISGCPNVDRQDKSGTTNDRGGKPVGLLLITRELDLGTLPSGGTMEVVMSLKNPEKKNSVTMSRYETSGLGIELEPGQFTIEAQKTLPLKIRLLAEATEKPGSYQWDIKALDPENRIAFLTTLKLEVKELKK